MIMDRSASPPPPLSTTPDVMDSGPTLSLSMHCCLRLEVEVNREKLWETGSKYSGFMGKEPVSSMLTYPKNQNYLMNQFGAHLTKEPVLCPLT